ncbi:MAG: A/G-specific adenine glycosylase [Candidatus Eisenbacteria bacterium]|uniref:Adenine DNA glycosylase n=1 Tax=Eiseniibacteriota bacterium TaxID=2212470 RepID=A0A538T349_UNCEI|nr:MAG: A/G-specific adenine glycosylase [Candidatus Eisenbacteria bacterium]
MNGGLRASILRWYVRHRRDLPWRRTREPYAIWVSEVMLQQTRVETVIPYYQRFLRRFPGVESLARARGADVQASWSGLGYYRRARHLHAAARIIVREHSGRVPSNRDALLSLPGIGEYTAGAIESIAFGHPAPAVDGNVVRVLARIHGYKGGRDSARLKHAVTEQAARLAPGPRAGDWTQALMELGARICLPRDPLCERCPAARSCAARRSGTPDRFPKASAARAPRAERRLLLVATSGRRILLVPDEADSCATWTLPYARLLRVSASSAARALARRHLPDPSAPEGPRATFRHRTFSCDSTYEVWCLDLGPGGAPARRPQRAATSLGAAFWATPGELRGLPVRAHTLKALSSLNAMA